jgi:hypothetical protein
MIHFYEEISKKNSIPTKPNKAKTFKEEHQKFLGGIGSSINILSLTFIKLKD